MFLFRAPQEISLIYIFTASGSLRTHTAVAAKITPANIKQRIWDLDICQRAFSKVVSAGTSQPGLRIFDIVAYRKTRHR